MPLKLEPENKIVVYLMLTALMVLTFACALVIINTTYGGIGWLVLLVMNVGILIYILRK